MGESGRDKVSVLMVVLDEEPDVGRAIESVLAQSHRELELLVVDGGSRDRTVEIASDYAARDGRVRTLVNRDRIIPAGLNVGLRAATGEYIARLDGHCRWSVDYLATALRVLQQEPQVVGVGGRRIGHGRSTTGRAIAAALGSPFGVGNSVYHYGRTRTTTDHATNGVYRRRRAVEVGGWDEALAVNEDVEFDHRVAADGGTIVFEPGMTTTWAVRESILALHGQYRRYGRGKFRMLAKSGPTALRARHLAAPALVAGLVVATVVAMLGERRLLAGLLSSYGLAIGGATFRVRAQAARRGEPVHALAVARAFVAMHLGWGVGFWQAGILGLRPAARSPHALTPEQTDPRRSG